jgi:hypothetical protein
MIVDEQIRNECEEPRQMAWFVDVTIERQFLFARRALRHSRLEREHGVNFL